MDVVHTHFFLLLLLSQRQTPLGYVKSIRQNVFIRLNIFLNISEVYLSHHHLSIRAVSFLHEAHVYPETLSNE